MRNDSPKEEIPRQWFHDVKARIAAFAREGHAPTPHEAPEDIPSPEAPAALLLTLARLWNSDRARLQIRDLGAQGSNSPESFAALADQYDIEAIYENRTTAKLREADLPAIVLTGDGGARLLIAHNGNQFLARSTLRTYDIAGETLAAEEKRALFRLRSLRIEDASTGVEHALDGADDPLLGVIEEIVTRRRPLLIQLLVAAGFSNLMLLALPIYTGIVFDRVIPHSAFDTLWAVSIGVMLALMADLAMRFVRIRLQDALAAVTSAAMQATLVRRLVEVRMSVSWFAPPSIVASPPLTVTRSSPAPPRMIQPRPRYRRAHCRSQIRRNPCRSPDPRRRRL